MPRDEIGPTWEDVYDYVNRLQLMWSVTIVLQMRLYKSGKPERLHGQCMAHASPEDRPLTEVVKVGYHQFRGNGGARTAPGAYWHALSDLEGRLSGIEKVGQSRLPIGGLETP